MLVHLIEINLSGLSCQPTDKVVLVLKSLLELLGVGDMELETELQ